MKAQELVLRGYIRQENDLWVAVCLDYSLADQGETRELAMEALTEQIREYVYDALVGADKDNLEVLLHRRAPLSQWVIYYSHLLKLRLHLVKDGIMKSIHLPVPMVPQNYQH